MDFSHFEAVSREDLDLVEKKVNERIQMFLPVTAEEMSMEEAKGRGAIGLFTQKYGNEVRVVSAGESCLELCGGLHVDNTGQIGSFKILSESGIASGIRRIEAIIGPAVADRLSEKEKLIQAAAKALKSSEGSLLNRIRMWAEENATMKKMLEKYEAAALEDVSKDILKDGVEINGINLVTKEFQDYTVDALRKISDDIREIAKNKIGRAHV